MARKAGEGGKRNEGAVAHFERVLGERLLGIGEVCARTSWSRPSWYRLMRAGLAPQSVALGDHRVAWKESDIDNYIASRCTNAKPRAFGSARSANQ
jgi:predicted DNA-binding transcriptional regulator AlpA